MNASKGTSASAAADFDVVIVGGGLVGASLGCALAPSGLRVAMIEAVPFKSTSQPSYDDRILALSQGSKRILTGLGAWDGIARRDATPIERVHISDRGHPGMARLRCNRFGVEALGYVVPARVLGAALLERLVQLAEVSIICPARVSDVRIGEARSEIRLHHEVDGERTLTARLAVLADGGRSKSRALLGIPARERDYRQTAILSTVTPEIEHRNTAYERFTATGPLALLPTSGNRSAVVWTTTRDRVEGLLALEDEVFLEQLQQRFGDRLGQLRRLGKRTSYPLTLVRVENVVRRRTVVIGNAAHTIHPVAGQGFNLGLRDVAVLADVLADALARDRDPGSLDVLQRYARWRRRDTRAVTAFTDSLIRAFANDFPPAVIARNLGLMALDKLPWAQRLLVRRTMGLAGKLPRLGLGGG